MTHSANGPTVSLEEAQRIERETSEHMLKARKLSLIVDLDQTIVHATVDPTVGEWIAEGEAWETRHEKRTEAAAWKKEKQEERERRKARREEKAKAKQEEQEKADGEEEDDEDDEDSDDTVSEDDSDEDEEENEVNPNWEALKDVKKFRLAPESFGGPPGRTFKGKGKALEPEGPLYYVKPRCDLPSLTSQRIY